jgi:hypothetical protein
MAVATAIFAAGAARKGSCWGVALSGNDIGSHQWQWWGQAKVVGTAQKSTSLGIVICTAHHSTDIESNSGRIVLSDKFELKTKETHGNKKWKKNKRD